MAPNYQKYHITQYRSFIRIYKMNIQMCACVLGETSASKIKINIFRIC